MSTAPLYQPPLPDASSNQRAYTSSATHGSVGPVIGVLAVITVLGVIAGMIGRMCSGKPVMGYGSHYDLEAWMQTKCASCIDGRVESPRPNRPVATVDMAGHTQPQSKEVPGEIKEEREDHHDHDHQEEDEDDEEQQEEEKVSPERN